ncbi:MAG: type IV pilus secretin PilQ [Candidatus Omnitrophica bacterium]|nr:type IV pilus secretin PilQ [Candidatus Omnitrophota bacterium]
MVRIWCLALLVLVLGMSVGFAQDKTVPVAVSAASPAVKPTVAAANAAVAPEPVLEFKMSKSGNVSLDFREADIKNVLKVLAYKSGINIIAGPEVVGMVNIQLKDVPWQKALDVILSTYGYSYEQKGTVIMVTTVENLKKRREDAKALADQEPVATETIILNFSKAEDVVKSLDKMKTARGSINFDVRTNSVIISDVGSNLELMKMVVKQLDTVTPQVLIEARIIETTLGKNDTLGINWGLSASASGSIRSTTLPWSVDSRSKIFPYHVVKDSVQTPSEQTSQIDPAAPAPAPLYGTLNASGLSAALDLLKSRNNSKVLSNPQIVTLDNQPAKVQVGQQIPMPQYTSNQNTGVLQISGWSYMDVGIVFDVTPHINNAHLVTLDIAPKITGVLSTIPAGGISASSSASMPVLSNESITTKVMIRDGETLVIAGLVTDTVSKEQTRVPLLGYIPVLGWPFQHTTDVHTKKDLVIFLTPHIITPTASTAALPVPTVSVEMAEAIAASTPKPTGTEK